MKNKIVFIFVFVLATILATGSVYSKGYGTYTLVKEIRSQVENLNKLKKSIKIRGEVTEKSLAPAIDENGKLNRDRIYYLMHSSVDNLSQKDYDEMINAFASLTGDNFCEEENIPVQQFMECCYEYVDLDKKDWLNISRLDISKYRLTQVYYEFLNQYRQKVDVFFKEPEMQDAVDDENRGDYGRVIRTDAALENINHIMNVVLLDGFKENIPYTYCAFNTKKISTKDSQEPRVLSIEITTNQGDHSEQRDIVVKVNGKCFYIGGWGASHTYYFTDVYKELVF